MVTTPGKLWCGNYTSRRQAPRDSLERLKTIAHVVRSEKGEAFLNGQ